MRTMIKVTAATLIILIGVSSSAQQPGGKFNYSPKSEKTALACSEVGLLGPAVIGAAIWATQSGKTVNYTAKRWYGPGLNDYVTYSDSYNEGPDRTVPIALIASGVVFGPAVGYFQGGCLKEGLISIGKRTSILAGTYALGYLTFDNALDDNSLTAAVLVSGGLLTIISAIHDVSAVKGAVREHNAARGKFTVSPVYFPDTDAAGVGLSIRF